MKSVFFLSLFLISSLGCLGQSPEPEIIITTPGYTSIYRCSAEDFCTEISNSFKMNNATATSELKADSSYMLTLKIGSDLYNFHLTKESPVARLQYDRNKRKFKGLGFNYIAREGSTYQAPSFKGTPLTRLPELWQAQIEKQIPDKGLHCDGKVNVFLLEADIDEKGNVHKIVELTGALKQYSQIFIEKVYELAVRGWEPAKCNGVPFRTIAQIQFVISQ